MKLLLPQFHNWNKAVILIIGLLQLHASSSFAQDTTRYLYNDKDYSEAYRFYKTDQNSDSGKFTRIAWTKYGDHYYAKGKFKESDKYYLLEYDTAFNHHIKTSRSDTLADHINIYFFNGGRNRAISETVSIFSAAKNIDTSFQMYSFNSVSLAKERYSGSQLTFGLNSIVIDNSDSIKLFLPRPAMNPFLQNAIKLRKRKNGIIGHKNSARKQKVFFYWWDGRI